MSDADTISPEGVKDMLLRYTCRFDPEDDADRNWSGCLNESNIFFVAARIRKALENKIFAIAEYRYVESQHPAWELRTDCFFNSSWTDGNKDLVRVFLKSEYSYIGFSAGGYCWSWDAAPGDDYDETHRYAYIDFDGDQVTFKQRAPNKSLHVHIFRVQRDNKIEDVR